ncbi:MAG: T9SS type A sorting domain-containing protein [Chitinophagales bacterium]|nr:T9SS type A sorting domain-containing protein [Chitinophagales bacterium]MBP8754088.1 T9SS type A sorting domain-containing protein [Chitinophagales bacterium]MBP9190277.1 T9SS type A sorting domain-containing protein [Chitinophagales bacterium]MBP9549018.1 T9SS type A sorting domain-containing protein [Chitinophagales bacterium]MBP9705539.1 T9SS type A sorting domain-containing protein [Chitinophagales bacterium]
MKKLFTSLTIITMLMMSFFTSNLQAQNWIKTYDVLPAMDDEASWITTIIQTDDDGYFFAGRTNYPGAYFGFVAKADANGDIIWMDTLSKDYSFANAYQRPDGNYAISKIEIFYDSVYRDVYSPSGTLLDEIMLDPTDGDYYDYKSLRSTPDNGFVVFHVEDGMTPSPTHEVQMQKYSSAGLMEWSYTLPSDSIYNYGFNTVDPTEDGYFYFANMQQHIYLWVYDLDIYVFKTHIIKVDLDGELVYDVLMDDRSVNDIIALPGGDNVFLLKEPETDYESVWPDMTNFYLQKRNSAGDILWEKDFPEFYEYYLGKLLPMDDGGFAVTVNGPIYDSTIFTNGNINLLFFDEEGNFEQQKIVEDGNRYEVFPVKKTSDNGFIFCGDMRDTLTSIPIAVLLKTDSLGNMDRVTLTGKVFYDANDNATYDDTDIVLPGLFAEILDEDIYAGTNEDGEFTRWIYEPGTYNIQVSNPTGFYQTSPLTESYTIVVDSISQVFDTLYFAKFADVDTTDLHIETEGYQAKPGFTNTYWINIFNDEVLPADDIDIQLIFDPILTLESIVYPNMTVSGDTLTISTGVMNGLSYELNPIQFSVPADTALIGDTLTFYAMVQSISDEITLDNNYDTLQIVITASYDPNMKTANPAGETELGFVDPSTNHIEYKIDFQNLGSDTAITIVVVDTLASEIDFSSFHMLSASNNYNIDFIYPNVVKWTFPNINLVHAALNEPESHGYLKFEVDLVEGLAEGTQFSNTAEIYFDYNPAVVTPPAFTTLKIYIPDAIANQNLNTNILAYPNPTSGKIVFNNLPQNNSEVFVYDINGKLHGEYSITEKENTIDVSALQNGNYILQIRQKQTVVYTGNIIVVK